MPLWKDKASDEGTEHMRQCQGTLSVHANAAFLQSMERKLEDQPAQAEAKTEAKVQAQGGIIMDSKKLEKL